VVVQSEPASRHTDEQAGQPPAAEARREPPGARKQRLLLECVPPIRQLHERPQGLGSWPDRYFFYIPAPVGQHGQQPQLLD